MMIDDQQRPADIMPSSIDCKEVHHEDCAGIAYRLQAL